MKAQVPNTRIILVEDDEDDFMLVRDMLSEASPETLRVDWVKTYQEALPVLASNEHGICFLDFRLGELNGLDLFCEARRMGCTLPFVLLTGQGDRELDLQAMRAGVDDYLPKDSITPDLLERSIRYALERRRSAERNKRLNRTLKMLSECNQALVHAGDESDLLKKICWLIVEPGGYKLAWIGFAERDEGKSVRPVAQCGFEDGYLETVRITWADTERGRGPTGTAIRNGKPHVVKNFTNDPNYAPWREQALRRGYASSISLPLIFEESTLGALNIYTSEKDAFDEEEIKLLKDLAHSLAYRIMALRTRQEHKLTLMDLRKERDFNKSLIEASPAFFAAIAPDGKVLMMNKAMLDALGYTADEVLGRDCLETFVDEQDREDVSGLFERILKNGQEVTSETYVLTRDKQKVLIEWHGQPMLAPSSDVEYLFGMGIDITERRRAEESLREREHYYRSLLEHLQEDILVIGRDYRVDDANKTVVAFAGRRREEIVGRLCHEVIQNKTEPCSKSGTRCLLEEVLSSREPAMARYKYTRPDGSWIWADAAFSPLVDKQGNTNRVISSIRDRTREVKLEKQLNHAQKMEAIGTLAGGIAHDFNNILGIMLGYTEVSLFKSPEDSPAHKNMQEVLKAGHRAKELVQQILAFSRRDEREHSPLQVSSILEEVLKLMRAALPSTIEIRDNTHTALGSDIILADATQIHQVIMNLCTNAGHAMRERGGILEVGLTLFSVREQDATSDLKPGEYVRLTVSDTGHGIDPAIIDRIFDPYFTTKQVGEGSGLGLAVTHGIVKSHSGAITCYSEPGKGTVFHVVFPRFVNRAASESEPEVSLPRGTEHILLVDDEPGLLGAGKAMLTHLGYRVTAKDDSNEALEAFRESPASFDLVITDHTMPRLTGLELASMISRIRPKIPIILCTGHNPVQGGITPERAGAAGVGHIALKPLILNDIAKMVRRVLDKTEHDEAGTQ